MANNDGQIILELDRSKTVTQINADIRKLQSQLKHVKATGALDTSSTVKQINAQIAALQSQLKAIKFNAKLDTNGIVKAAQHTGQQIGNNIAHNISEGLNRASGKVDTEVQKLVDKIVAAVLNNFDTVAQSLESMSNSAGNAEAEMTVAMDSIHDKLNAVKETGTGIAQNLFAQEDMKSVLDVIGSIGNGIDWLTGKLGLFKTIGAGDLGAGIIKFVKSFD